MLRLIESYEDDHVVSIHGRTFPSTCLIEDDEDATRILLTEGSQVAARDWTRAHSSGARMVVIPDPLSEGWLAITVEDFIEHRVEHHPSRSFQIDLARLRKFEDFPTWRGILGSTSPIRSQGSTTSQDSPLNRGVDGDDGITSPQGRTTDFVHLHAHSEFSPLDGLSKVEEMVEAVVADDQPAMAVTDHGVCASHPLLQKEADKAGIKPIFGIEANFTDDRLLRGDPSVEGHAKTVLDNYRHLVMWAKTDEGLRNIWGMSTEANSTGFYGRPRMDWDTLEKFSEGVMASTACLRGPLAWHLMRGNETAAREALSRLLGIFGDDLFIELHTNSLSEQRLVNEVMVAFATEYGVPLVAVSDSHYPKAEDKYTHRVWIASQTNKGISDDADLFAGEADYHLLTGEEVRKSLDYLPDSVVSEAMANTLVVAERAQAQVKGEIRPPIFSKKETPEESVQRDVERLVDACMANWHKTEGKRPSQSEYEARFEREMRLLINKRFCGYYLMVFDYVDWARKNGILVGPGRGSGSGSLVSYLLGITGIDPVETGLMFERFLTEGRKGLPDFDVDFPSSKREAIQGYITEKYGQDYVMRVGTVTRLKNKGVVKAVQRVLGKTVEIQWTDIETVCAIIDAAESDKAGLGMPWDDLWDEHSEVLDPFREKYPELFALCDRMVGRLHAYSKHPAGVIISTDEILSGRYPLRRAGDDLVAEFDMNSLEELGLVKFDILTLRNLDTIQTIIDLVHERYGVLIVPDDWREEYDDSKVWDEIGAGHTLGIFQIETPGGTRDAKRFKPRSLDELADLITLVRPGPKRSGLTDMYHRRKFGGEEVTVPDPRLESILAGTYGVMIYQEQVMQTCMALAGYDSTEADVVRKILGKKQVEKVEEAGKKFITRAVENGTDPQVAETIWTQMAEFARYSFNRAHAYGYAMLGAWTAWPKFNYPDEGLTGLMSTVDKGRIPEFVSEARRMAVRILPPDVNESGADFTPGKPGSGVIRYGLAGLKGLGDAAVETIIANQPYESLEDFLERSGANMGVVKTLAAIGGLDSLVENRKALEARLEWQTSKAPNQCALRDESVEGPNGLPCTFDWDNEPVILGKSGRPLKPKPLPKRCAKTCRQFVEPIPPDFDSMEPYTDDEIMKREMELIGVHLSSTPFDRIPEDVLADLYTGDQVEEGPNGVYVIAALVTKIRPHTAKNNKEMGFLGLDAQATELDVTVFSDEWADYKRDLHKGLLCLAEVSKNSRGLTLTGLHPL